MPSWSAPPRRLVWLATLWRCGWMNSAGPGSWLLRPSTPSFKSWITISCAPRSTGRCADRYLEPPFDLGTRQFDQSRVIRVQAQQFGVDLGLASFAQGRRSFRRHVFHFRGAIQRRENGLQKMLPRDQALVEAVDHAQERGSKHF